MSEHTSGSKSSDELVWTQTRQIQDIANVCTESTTDAVIQDVVNVATQAQELTDATGVLSESHLVMDLRLSTSSKTWCRKFIEASPSQRAVMLSLALEEFNDGVEGVFISFSEPTYHEDERKVV